MTVDAKKKHVKQWPRNLCFVYSSFSWGHFNKLRLNSRCNESSNGGHEAFSCETSREVKMSTVRRPMREDFPELVNAAAVVLFPQETAAVISRLTFMGYKTLSELNRYYRKYKKNTAQAKILPGT